jgi:hypothetical protein
MNLDTLTLDCHSAASVRDEVCPLCLGRYAAAVECICDKCEAPSCPDCAEVTPDTDNVVCYACHGPTKH